MSAHQAIHHVLSHALARGDIHLLGEALELWPSTAGLLGSFPQRVHLLPAADASLIGVGIGLAMGGARPVISLSGPDALWGVLQQLGQEAAPLRAAGEFTAPVVLRVPLAPGQSIPPALAAIEGIVLASPSSAEEAVGLLKSALCSSDPVVLIEPLAVLHGATSDDPPAVPFAEARCVRAGSDATLLAWGEAVAAAEEAADALADAGIAVEILDLRTVRPLDTAAISQSIHKTGRPVLCGCPASVLPEAVRAAFLRLESPPQIAGPASIFNAVKTSVVY